MLTHTEAAAAVRTFGTKVVEMLLDLAETDRQNLVNRYVGADRAEKIQRNNEVVAVLEGELAARRGLTSSKDLLAAITASHDFVAVQNSAHLAYLLDVDEDEKAPAQENLTLSIEQAKALPKAEDSSYEVGQRIIVVGLPHIGATITSTDSFGIGVRYDDDDDDQDDDSYEAEYSRIRPMPYL